MKGLLCWGVNGLLGRMKSFKCVMNFRVTDRLAAKFFPEKLNL
jgi:hypothetical protein